MFNEQLLIDNQFQRQQLLGGRFTVYRKGNYGIIKGANGRPFIVDADTVMRKGNLDGYKSTEEAIQAFDKDFAPRITRLYEDGMIITDGAEERIGKMLGLSK